jgi:hypothetical protein
LQQALVLQLAEREGVPPEDLRLLEEANTEVVRQLQILYHDAERLG